MLLGSMLAHFLYKKSMNVDTHTGLECEIVTSTIIRKKQYKTNNSTDTTRSKIYIKSYKIDLAIIG